MLKTPVLNHDMTLQVLPVSTFAFSYREGKWYLRPYILERSSQDSTVLGILFLLVFIIGTANRTVKS